MRWTVVRKLLAALAIFGMLASGIGLASYVIFNSPDQQAGAPVRTPPKPPPPSIPTTDEFLIGVVVTAQNCDPPEACVYVGDFVYDLQAARNAGMAACLLRNPGNQRFVDQADLVIDRLDELLPLAGLDHS